MPNSLVLPAMPRKGWLLAAAITGAWITSPVLASEELAKKNCMVCHRLDKAGMGPSLMDISKKYKSDPDGHAKIVSVIRTGSKDVTGEGKMMAPMANVNDADANSIATYILSLTATRYPEYPSVIIPADYSQCATYDPSRQPQVQIPCVQVGEGVYAAGLNQVAAPAGGLRFELAPGSVQPATTIATETCALLPLDSINRLYIPCLNLGSSKPWVMLDLSNTNPMTFDFVEFGEWIPAP